MFSSLKDRLLTLSNSEAFHEKEDSRFQILLPLQFEALEEPSRALPVLHLLAQPKALGSTAL
jgi:hypothetical protein